MTGYYSPYIGTSERERHKMLQEIGKRDIHELFSDIPQGLKLDEPIDIPGPYSEAELSKLFSKIAQKSMGSNQLVSLLGGGIRQQYIPAAIEELMRRGELYTSYTPYQPEISQGLLQLLYEYQSMVAEILSMDVVNASMYDWASALGEALLVMSRLTKREKIILAEPIAPNRIAVAEAYAQHSGHELVVIPSNEGKPPFDDIVNIFREEISKDSKDREYAGIYFEVPSYYGTLPDYPQQICDLVHEAGSLVTVGVDITSLGILTPPGEYGADFVVGEGQLLGNAPSTGGPLLGILASKYDRKWIRQIPGRLIGATTEANSTLPGYCITLQTREQHIRREKATSNICTNESITAVNAAIYLAALGKQGFVELSQGLTDRAHYLANRLNEIPQIIAPVYRPFFCEFVVNFGSISHKDLEKKCIEHGYIPGKKIDGESCLRLIGVSDLHTKEELDGFVEVIKEIL